MHDILKRRDISRSIAEDPSATLLKIAPRAIDEHADYVRRSVRRPDYASAVALGHVPPWERALAMVATLVPVLRGIHAGSFPPRVAPDVTRCAYVPPDEPPDPKPVERVIPNADVAGYVYDSTWSNGGIASYAPDKGTDPVGVRVKPVQGIAAFRSVEKMGAIAEIAWFYCGADFELGVSSWFDGVTAMALSGATPGESSGSAPKGPGDLARLAAAEHRRILGMISRLKHRHERTTRIAYTDARCPSRLVSAYGVGNAPIIWRAQQEAGETDARGGYVEPGSKTLDRLVELVRADWPDFTGQTEGDNEPIEDRIRRAADLILWTAHERYRILGLPPGPSPFERVALAMATAKRSSYLDGGPPDAPRPRRRRRHKVRPDMVPAGDVGRQKRRLVELREVRLPDADDEPRAA